MLRKLARVTLNVLTALSLALCVGVAAAWLASHHLWAIRLYQTGDASSVNISRGDLLEWTEVLAQYPMGRFVDLHVRWRVPLWPAVVAMAVLPAVWLWRRLRCRSRDRLARRGLCPACGYDLRATPGRCPECGAAPAHEKPAASAGGYGV